MPESQNIHIQTSHKKLNLYILALFIPAVLFSAVLFFTINKSPKKEAFATTQIEPQQENKQITIGNVQLSVEIADSEAKRQKGLGGRLSLPQNQGMLFVFPQNSSPRFWMKDMLFPIDIIWIKDNKVTQITKNIPAPDPNTSEFNLEFYLPNDPIDYVLEVPAGFSDTNNINLNDPVDLSQI